MRTADPYEANLFYIPDLSFGHGGNIPIYAGFWLRALSYVRTHYPFWDAHNGTDHIMWRARTRHADLRPTALAAAFLCVRRGPWRRAPERML